MKDWTGNKKTVFSIIGSNSKGNREKHDYYATDPKAVEFLLNLEKFNSPIWEPACGAGHISKILEKNIKFYQVTNIIIMVKYMIF